MTPVNTYFKQWTKIGASNLSFLKPATEFSFGISSFTAVNESQSLVNYFECSYKPYVTPSRVYEIEIEVEVTLYFYLNYYANSVSDALAEGRYDNLVLFQLLQDGQELRSNRPSSVSYGQNRFEKNYKSNDPGAQSHTVVFKLVREFEVGSDGYLSVRFLSPITGSSFNFPSGISQLLVAPKVLKVTVVDASDDENIKASRNIEFTQSKTIDLPITSSVNAGIKNSFSIGSRIGEKEMIVPVIYQQSENFSQVFPPLNDLLMVTKKFPITNNVSARLFDQNKTKSLFIESPDGRKRHFFSVYTRKEIGIPKLFYLINYSGRPFKPKDYVRTPEIQPGDLVKLKLSDFTAENVALRENWSVYGFTGWIESYPKTVANVIHSVRKDPSFGLETTVLALMLPDQLLNFYFAGESRNFIPTRLELDLTSGKTTVNLKEATFNHINDISYE